MTKKYALAQGLVDLSFSEYVPQIHENITEINPYPELSAESKERFLQNCVDEGILVEIYENNVVNLFQKN